MTFTQELVIVTIDKLLFAVVLAVFAYYLNRLIERFRATLAFATELNKTRVVKIAAVWEKLYEFEHEATTGTLPTSEKQAVVQNLFGQLHELMHANRFWIGPRHFEQLNAYKVLLNDVVQARAAGDAAKVAELERQVSDQGQSVSDIRDRLLAGELE
jgi:hypothetical protein